MGHARQQAPSLGQACAMVGVFSVASNGLWAHASSQLGKGACLKSVRNVSKTDFGGKTLFGESPKTKEKLRLIFKINKVRKAIDALAWKDATAIDALAVLGLHAYICEAT